MLDEALALPPTGRESWLVDLAGTDPHMAAILRQLLSVKSAHATLDQLSPEAPARLLANAMLGSRFELAPGMMVGPYRLLHTLGAGGMASVWLAEQTTAVIRQVALKIPHVGLEPRAATTNRFARERDLLAALEHERIARLYDAGVSVDGVPFLAMEWIDGVPITRYCDEHRLPVIARIALFRQVLDAVAFAHTRLVIHRDLKPSNILVTRRGQVKLLDFGVANLLASDASATVAGAADALTPDTASPEQLAGAPLGTSSDVYSLGVILYELLTGHKPYTLDRSSPSLHAALMATTVQPLSEAVTEAAAAERAMSLAQLRRSLGAEIEAIVGRCLARAPAQRYSNVESLAADLDRLARREPVSAFGDGLGYRLRCFVRRQRWPLAASTALVMAVFAGSAATLWQGQQALAQARRAQAIQAFLLSLFRSNTPAVAEGHETTARELLARGSQRADSDLKDQPLALAELHSELGDIYDEMGDETAALEHLDRALAGFRALGLADSRDGLTALFRHGTVLMGQSQDPAARADLLRCLERGRQLYGPRHRWAVGAREKLAFMLLETGESQAAADMAVEALAQPVGEDLANDELRRLRVLVILGEAQTDLGDYRAARATLSRAVALSEGSAGYSAVDRLVYRVLLTRAIFYSGDAAAAEPAAGALVKDEERILGASHPLVFPARQLWSHSLAQLGRYSEAIDVQRRSLELAESQPAPSAERIAGQRQVLAAQLALAGRYREAEPLARQALAQWGTAESELVPRRPLARRVLGVAMLGQNRLPEAQTELDLAITEGRRLPHYTTQPEWPVLLGSAADVRRLAGDLPGALPLLAESCAVLGHSPGIGSPPALRCMAMLTWLRASAAPRDAAARGGFDSAASAYADALPASHLGRLDLMLLASELDALTGQPAARDLDHARTAWAAIVGSRPPARIAFLH